MDIHDAKTYLCMDVQTSEQTVSKKEFSLFSTIKILISLILTIATFKYKSKKSQQEE